ncbi:MAG: adenylate/guanylate cyclase domain-containing protein [Pseudomonadota bacterium]
MSFKFNKTFILSLVFCLIITCFTIFLLKLAAFSWLEMAVFDYRSRLATDYNDKSTSNISLITIDESSLLYMENKAQQPWPWSRDVYVPVLGFLKESGAKAIIFDMIFDKSDFKRADIDGYDADIAFADACRDHNTLYHSAIFKKQEGQYSLLINDFEKRENTFLEKSKICIDKSVLSKLPEMKSAILPIEALIKASKATGVANIDHSYSNVKGINESISREVKLLYKYKEQIIPHMGLRIAMDLKGIDCIGLTNDKITFSGGSIPVNIDQKLLLKWYGLGGTNSNGKSLTFNYYSFRDVLLSGVAILSHEKPLLPINSFKDKIVIIGGTASLLFDLKNTPMGRKYPGMEMQATIIKNIMNNDFIYKASVYYTFIVVILLSLFLCLIFFHIHRWYSSVLILFITLIGLTFINFTLFIKHSLFLDYIPPVFAVFLSFIMAILYNLQTEGKKRKDIKKKFQHYVGASVVNEMMNNPSKFKLGGEKRVLTVMFADIAGFTAISEKLSPEKLSSMFNVIFTYLTDIIIKHDGTLDKYIGDCIMSFFGAPVAFNNHADMACKAAFLMNLKIGELAKEYSAEAIPGLSMRIGINSGEVIVGNMGSKYIYDYTVLGDSVNLASRIEGVNKVFGTAIIISEDTKKLLTEKIILRMLGSVRVKGKARPVILYEIRGLGTAAEYELELIQEFEKALQYYKNKQVDLALQSFRNVLSIEDNDQATKYYINLCQNLIRVGYNDKWDWTIDLKSK